MTVPDPFRGQPPEARRTGGGHRVDPDHGGAVAGRQCRASVEPEPSEPQQRRAEHDERQVVWTHVILAEADPFAQDQGQSQSCRAGVDVNCGSSGEVNRLELIGDPATLAEE